MRLQTNDSLEVYINQGRRPAFVLAVLDDMALIEYEMPRGTTTLRLIPTDGNLIASKNLSYNAVPRRWLKAIVANNLEWVGNPQQVSKNSVPTAKIMLENILIADAVKELKKSDSRS